MTPLESPMRKPAAVRRVPPRRRGLGIVELLVSLAIAATLLVATAAAINASLRAYRINQDHAQLQQRARLAMNRMVSAIRASTAHSAAGPSISMTDEAGQPLAFRHDPARRELLLVRNGKSHVLCRNVTGFSVVTESTRSEQAARAGSPPDLLACVTLRLTATAGRQSLTLSASAAPRRNTW
jgi:Tfp pilus assembly protein FimT